MANLFHFGIGNIISVECDVLFDRTVYQKLIPLDIANFIVNAIGIQCPDILIVNHDASFVFALCQIFHQHAHQRGFYGILVHKIDEAVEGQRDRLILVAVKGEKQVLMLNRLRYLGCKNVILADNDIISYLQEAEVQADERGI